MASTPIVTRRRPIARRRLPKADCPGRYAIGCFGRVRAQKGTDVFVEAMCRLLPRYPDFTAVIVGAVVPEQQGFANGLKKQIEAAGLAVAHRHHRRTRNRGSAALVPAADDLRLHLAQRRLWLDADRGDVVGRGAGGVARGRGRIRGRGWRDRRADAAGRCRRAGRRAGALDARSGLGERDGCARAGACAARNSASMRRRTRSPRSIARWSEPSPRRQRHRGRRLRTGSPAGSAACAASISLVAIADDKTAVRAAPASAASDRGSCPALGLRQ